MGRTCPSFYDKYLPHQAELLVSISSLLDKSTPLLDFQVAEAIVTGVV